MALVRLRVSERSTQEIAFDILNQAEESVPASSLSTATLTLYDVDTYVPDASPIVGIINGRDGVDVLNAHGVTIDADGHVVWTMDPADNPIVTERRQIERHRAQFHFTWSGGAFHQEIEIEVENLRSVT